MSKTPKFEITPSLIERFHRSYKISDSGCWEWQGYLSNGYGSLRLPKGHKIRAHKLSWIIHNGDIPEGQILRHVVCDNRKCVNPTHLALGSQKDNIADMFAKGRSAGKAGAAFRYSDEQKGRIFSAWDLGRTAVEIAAEEGLTEGQVRGLLSRRRQANN